MPRSLFRDLHALVTAPLTPAALFIFFLHALTTGRFPQYLYRYLYQSAAGSIDPVCVSIEYDAVYLTAFISFFLVLPCALASRIDHSISHDLVGGRSTASSPSQSVTQFRKAAILLLVFIVIHSLLLPSLLYFPLGRPLWVEHNFARNAVFFSIILLLVCAFLFVVAFLLQLLRGDESTPSNPPRSHSRATIVLLFGTPLSSIAFWLTSSIFVSILSRASTWLAGSVYSPGPAAVTLITSVIALGITLATIVGQRLQIWRSPLRAIILIAVVSFTLHLSAPQTFPIDWFETCAIWTD